MRVEPIRMDGSNITLIGLQPVRDPKISGRRLATVIGKGAGGTTKGSRVPGGRWIERVQSMHAPLRAGLNALVQVL